MSLCAGGTQVLRRALARRKEISVPKRVGPVTVLRERRRLSARKGLVSPPSTNAVTTDLDRYPALMHRYPDEDTESDAESGPVRRVMLKISGEALQGGQGCGIDPTVLRSVALEIAASWKEGYQIAIVVGGGNFFRGEDAFEGIDRVTADHVGMLATTMNAVCLQSMLENLGVHTRVQTAIEIKEVAEPYIRRRAIRHLEKGRVVIFGAGTGNPFFTTDMAAALRAAEICADEILKATKVDGVYSSDPKKDPGAELLDHITYDRALKDRLQFMDNTAMALCRDQSIPIRVFSLLDPGNISRAIRGESVGSTMQHKELIVKKETDPMSHLNKIGPAMSVTSL